MAALRPLPAMLLLLTLLAGCRGDAPPANTRPHRVGLYAAEAASYPTIARALPTLAERQLELLVAVPEQQLGSADLEDLVRQATRLGVEVRLWPLLPKHDGYWVNETNIDRFAGYVRRLLDWIDREDLTVSTVIYDVEPAISYSEELQQAYAEGLGSVVSLLRRHVNPGTFAQARAALSDSVREVQARGLRAECVTFPQVLDDLDDDDTDLQDAFDIPVDGVPWDELSFMVYQSVYAETVGAWIGPSLIRTYSAAARQRYGDRATIALGVVGQAGVMTAGTKLYPDPTALGADVAAALAEGIGRLELFSLDGMLETKKLESWLAVIDTEAKRPADTFNATLARQAMVALDVMLGQPETPDGTPPLDAGADLQANASDL